MVKIVSAVLVALILSLRAAEPPPADHTRTETSPRNDIIVRHHFRHEGGEEISLALTTDGHKQAPLFTTDRSADVLFSDDEAWLVINDHWGSNGSSALLFVKKGSLDYQKDLDLTSGAWDFFAQHQHIAPPSLDHRYVEAIRWIDQPRAILLELSGHMDSKHHVDSWFCIYYVDSKRFSTDLDALNKQQVTLHD